MSAVDSEPAGRWRKSAEEFSLHAINPRLMFMDHAWSSQVTWLRHIAACDALRMQPAIASAAGHRVQLTEDTCR